MKNHRDKVTKLTPEHTGRWLITTMGSTHVIDLDARTIARSPRQEAARLDWDRQTEPYVELLIWPEVGEAFAIAFAKTVDPELQGRTVRVRTSSMVRSIEQLGPGCRPAHGEEQQG